jgi:hypothetical protein
MARHNHHTDLCVRRGSCRLPPSAAGLPSGKRRLLLHQDAAGQPRRDASENAKLKQRLENPPGAVK